MFFGMLFFIFISGVGIYAVYKEFGAIFGSGRSSWEKKNAPDLYARIQLHETNRMVYANRRVPHLKTNVYFTDGFIFESHQTNNSMTGLLSYELKVDEATLISIYKKAVDAHYKAVVKKLKLHQDSIESVRQFMIEYEMRRLKTETDDEDALALRQRQIHQKIEGLSVQELLFACATREEEKKEVKRDTSRPVYSAPEQCWVCNHCGTSNKANYAMCKKCAKYRTSN